MNDSNKTFLIITAVVVFAICFTQNQRQKSDVTPVEPPPTPGEISVLIVEETADRGTLPPAQLEAMFSKRVRDYLNDHCDEWRLLDDDADMSHETEKWQEVMQRKHESLPAIVISNGKTGTEGDLPGTADELMELLEKWGGK